MLIQLMQRYSLKLLFALSLLLGLQLPSFLMQYEVRLDAHYKEAKSQLNQYQALADLHFSGDLQRLILKHKQSDVLLFRAEAPVIEKLLNRVIYLKKKKDALQGPLVSRIYFLLGETNTPLLRETKENYNAALVLNQHSILVGLLLALLSTLLLELLFFLGAYQIKRLRYYFSLKQQ